MPKKYLLIYMLLLSLPLISVAVEINKLTKIDSQVKFTFLNELGEVYKSWNKEDILNIVNPKVCTLSVLADDESFNTYNISLSLVNDNNVSGAVITGTSRYIDEKSRYHVNHIHNLTIGVSSVKVPNKNWEAYDGEKEYMLINPTVIDGVNLYHHLTMGQPMSIEIEQRSKVDRLWINVAAMKPSEASAARVCMKKIHGE
mgnify:CR=1 FL=1